MSIAGSFVSIESPGQRQHQASANACYVPIQLDVAQCELTISTGIVNSCDDPCNCQVLLCTSMELKVVGFALMTRCSCISLQMETLAHWYIPCASVSFVAIFNARDAIRLLTRVHDSAERHCCFSVDTKSGLFQR